MPDLTSEQERGIIEARQSSTWNDETYMPFGEHKGKKLGNIPDSYLQHLHGVYKDTGEYKYYPQFRTYLDDNIDAIRANLLRNK
jgi:hypothetical protein